MRSHKFVVPLVVLFLVNESLGRPGFGDLLAPVGLLNKNNARSHAESASQSFGTGFNVGPIGFSGAASSSKSAASSTCGGSASAASQGGAWSSGGNAGSQSSSQAQANTGAQALFPFAH